MKSAKLIIKYLLLILYYGFAQWLPSSNRKFGRWARPIRRIICEKVFLHSGENINIEARAFFAAGSEISIGDNSSIGIRAELHGPVHIGKNVMMGPDVLILTANHNTDRIDIPMIQQGMGRPKKVIIGDDVWIGQRATILPGVIIGEGVIVGACTVVTKSVLPYSVVVGNPGRIVKRRET